MKLSIILVNYNTKKITDECLTSLYKYVDLQDIEVILVDNNSTDGTVGMIEHKFPNVNLIVNNDNLGFAKANNIGIKKSKGNCVLLLNTDTIVIEDFVNPIIKYVEETDHLGVLSCKVLNKDRTLQYTCWNVPTLFTELSFFLIEIITSKLNPLKYWKYMKYWDHNTTRNVDCVSGCFMWINRDVLNELGGLDENFFMYYEDTEYCMRIRSRSPYKVVYFPFTQIIHLGGGSFDRTAPNPNGVKYCYNSLNYLFKITHGLRFQKLFNLLCKMIWRIELVIFYMFREIPLFNKKYRLVKWILS